MKPLFTSLLLILLSSMAQQSQVFTCTVLEPDKVVACPASGNPQNSTTLWLIQNWHPDLVDEWRWVARHENSPVGGAVLAVNLPLEKEPLKAGQKVKATLGEDGHLIPVARCDVRIYRQVNKYLDHGDRAPLSAWMPPEDCKK